MTGFTSRVTCTIGVAFALSFAACAPEDEAPQGPPFSPKYETEHLRIGTDFDTQPCRGLLDLWEAQVSAIEDHLGVYRDHVWIYQFQRPEPLQLMCGREPIAGDGSAVAGCWNGTVIFALGSAIPHELVHAWTMATNPDPAPILREGLAERMSGQVTGPGGPVRMDDLLAKQWPGYGYTRSAHFVAWLMATHGVDSLMALYARSSRGASASELAAAFRATLGPGPEEVLAAYEAAPRTYYPGLGSLACGTGEVVAWEGDAATWQAEGSCLEGPLIGYETGMWQRLAVDVPASGTYVLDTGRRPASLTRCLTVPTFEAELQPSARPISDDWDLDAPPLQSLFQVYGRPSADEDEDWADLVLDLAAGRYEILIAREAYEHPLFQPIEMSLRRV